MPPKKKDADYVPIDPTTVKRSLSIPQKEKPNVETIEHVGRIISSRTSSANKVTRKATVKKARKKSVRKVTKKLMESPVKRRGKGEYVLVITEKPQAAGKIAEGLSAGGGKMKKVNITGGVYYYEVTHNSGEKLVVACAVGHLFGLTQSAGEKGWPIFNVEWQPSFNRKGSEFTKKYYSALRSLAAKAKSFIAACDYDVEGEVIGWNILRFICGVNDASRMKFSSLTKDEIQKAYRDLSPSIDWGQAIAGETRHHLDWFYGINLSRALMEAVKKAGSFRIMSVGRVQGPALNLVVKKEREIAAFIPTPFWQVFINIDWKGENIELKNIKDLTKASDLKKFEGFIGRSGDAKTISKEQIIKPHPPFDLTTLQTEAYKFFGLTPSQSLATAQKLYLAGLISYPRTSSQKIPEGVDVKSILDKLGKSKFKDSVSLVVRARPIEGAKTDPAHPAIHPTGELEGLSDLNRDELNLYDLICKRFIASFCPDARVLNRKITVEIDNEKFAVKGVEINDVGWTAVYPMKFNERELPTVEGNVEIINVRSEEKETQPPRRYSPASLVSELSKRNLGTKATRAAIVETLYDRGYIREKSIEATPIGMALIKSLESYCSVIIDEKLTRDFEKEIEGILSTKKDLLKREEGIINKAKGVIRATETDFRKNESIIGKDLIDAFLLLRSQEREANKLNTCPVCGKGNLQIMYSKRFRKSFVACNAYPECKTTFGLPAGVVKRAILTKDDKEAGRSERTCIECGWPKLILLKRGRRPWEFCFNTVCPTRKDKEQTEPESDDDDE